MLFGIDSYFKGRVDREMGNEEGFDTGLFFDFKTIQRGVATHIYAAFDPNISGMTRPFAIKNQAHREIYRAKWLVPPRLSRRRSFL